MHPLHVMIESQRRQARHQYPQRRRSSRRRPLRVYASAGALLVCALAVAALLAVAA